MWSITRSLVHTCESAVGVPAPDRAHFVRSGRRQEGRARAARAGRRRRLRLRARGAARHQRSVRPHGRARRLRAGVVGLARLQRLARRMSLLGLGRLQRGMSSHGWSTSQTVSLSACLEAERVWFPGQGACFRATERVPRSLTFRVSLAGSLLILGDLVFCLGEPLALSSLPPLPLSSLPPLLLGPSSPNSAVVDRARAASSSASAALQPGRSQTKKEGEKSKTYFCWFRWTRRLGLGACRPAREPDALWEDGLDVHMDTAGLLLTRSTRCTRLA